MVLVQKWPFFRLFSFRNIGQENVFYDILERINAFLGNIGNIGEQNVFYDILERKTAFLCNKNKKFKKL